MQPVYDANCLMIVVGMSEHIVTSLESPKATRLTALHPLSLTMNSGEVSFQISPKTEGILRAIIDGATETPRMLTK